MGINMNMDNTKSNVLRKVIPLKNVLVDIIDKNQSIKRLARYLTSQTPFFETGLTYDGKKISQPDLQYSLKNNLLDSEDVCATSRGEILIPYAFDTELLKESKMLIFVESPRSRIRVNNSTVTHEFRVTIAVNVDYNPLEPFGNERSMEILCCLLDDIESKYLQGIYREELGVIKFEVDGDRITERFSDKGFIATTIPISARVIGDRYRV